MEVPDNMRRGFRLRPVLCNQRHLSEPLHRHHGGVRCTLYSGQGLSAVQQAAVEGTASIMLFAEFISRRHIGKEKMLFAKTGMRMAENPEIFDQQSCAAGQNHRHGNLSHHQRSRELSSATANTSRLSIGAERLLDVRL